MNKGGGWGGFQGFGSTTLLGVQLNSGLIWPRLSGAGFTGNCFGKSVVHKRSHVYKH